MPIFHCNGDDPEAVVKAFEMAIEWRQQWNEDCIIDMVYVVCLSVSLSLCQSVSLPACLYMALCLSSSVSHTNPPLHTPLAYTHITFYPRSNYRCYRRYGHNELDQPMYTQPALYKKIAKHPDTLTVYEQQLIREGTATSTCLCPSLSLSNLWVGVSVCFRVSVCVSLTRTNSSRPHLHFHRYRAAGREG